MGVCVFLADVGCMVMIAINLLAFVITLLDRQCRGHIFRRSYSRSKYVKIILPHSWIESRDVVGLPKIFESV